MVTLSRHIIELVFGYNRFVLNNNKGIGVCCCQHLSDGLHLITTQSHLDTKDVSLCPAQVKPGLGMVFKAKAGKRR
jgi:hypothetical protein